MLTKKARVRQGPIPFAKCPGPCMFMMRRDAPQVVRSAAGASAGSVCMVLCHKHARMDWMHNRFKHTIVLDEDMCIPWSHRKGRPRSTRANRRLPRPKSCSAAQQKTVLHSRRSGGDFFCISHTLRSTAQKIQCHAKRWPRGHCKVRADLRYERLCGSNRNCPDIV